MDVVVESCYGLYLKDSNIWQVLSIYLNSFLGFNSLKVRFNSSEIRFNSLETKFMEELWLKVVLVGPVCE